MDYRQLGSSGLRVSVLALGTMTFGGVGRFSNVGDTDVQGATRQIDLCLEAGVNLIDTANTYSQGTAEEILGVALKGRRDDVCVATKARMPMGDGPNDAGLSRNHLIEQCDASLRRLQTDRIDLYQLHAWDGQTPLEETLEALRHLVDHGKVRYVGCSNYSAWHLMKALGVAEREGLPRFVTTQNFYAPAFRDVEYELVPAALDQRMGMLVWSPLAGGLMSGKYRRDQDGPEGSRQLSEWDEPPVRDTEALYDVIDALVEIGEAHGVSAAQVALAWLLTRPAVTSLIIGARTDEQLQDNLAAADLELTDDEVARIEEVSRPPLLYPYWHQLKTASDRLSPADLSLLGDRAWG
ncbi:MAG: aldo/keto reductase [Actinomycetota bacterium]|nr:aldo/keto reductase [Actinomycetota bacterium]